MGKLSTMQEHPCVHPFSSRRHRGYVLDAILAAAPWAHAFDAQPTSNLARPPSPNEQLIFHATTDLGPPACSTGCTGPPPSPGETFANAMPSLRGRVACAPAMLALPSHAHPGGAHLRQSAFHARCPWPGDGGREGMPHPCARLPLASAQCRRSRLTGVRLGRWGGGDDEVKGLYRGHP